VAKAVITAFLLRQLNGDRTYDELLYGDVKRAPVTYQRAGRQPTARTRG
jgi:hypothetical protein